MDESFFFDSKRIRRSFDTVSRRFEAAAVVHREVRQRAIDRLELLREQPQTILDLGAGTGAASLALKQRYPKALVIALDSSIGMLELALQQTSTWQRMLGRRLAVVGGDANAIPLRNGSVDWVFSNLMLPWCSPVDSALIECHRVLRPNGLFAFSSFGPDTLRELRDSWAAVDNQHHVHPFLDMHDLGDALIRAGFAEPVLDVERFTLTYPDMEALLRDLRAMGSRNALMSRNRSFTGRGSFKNLTAAYESRRQNGTLPVTCEVVYGLAWRGMDKTRPNDRGEIRVPIDVLRRGRR